MSDIFKPRRRFISALLTTIMLMRGRVDFRNMSRYSLLSEKTFPRQFGNPSDFAGSDGIGIEMVVPPHTMMIAVTDFSFIPESGSHTYGLARFHNGIRSEVGKGLEISQLAVADVSCGTAYNLSARQTPDTFSSEHTRSDRYVGHLTQDAPCLPPSVRHAAADGYYAGKKSADSVTDAGYHLISEPRHDADPRFLYAGKQKPKGRPGIYDGKVRSDDSTRSGSVGETDSVSLHTAVANSPSPKRGMRVVYLVRHRSDKTATALLFSADIHLPAADIHRFYKARFRIGFLFRDAEQSAGLSDCQSRREISPDFRFNACMSALSVMKRESRRTGPSETSHGWPIASAKIRNFDEYLMKRFCDMSDTDFGSVKSADAYHRIINPGAVAA